LRANSVKARPGLLVGGIKYGWRGSDRRVHPMEKVNAHHPPEGNCPIGLLKGGGQPIQWSATRLVLIAIVRTNAAREKKNTKEERVGSEHGP